MLYFDLKSEILNREKKNPQMFVDQLARQKLREYRSPDNFQLQYDLQFKTYSKTGSKNGSNEPEKVLLPNLDVPPYPPLTPVVNLDGSPFFEEKVVYCTQKLPGWPVRRILKKKLVQKKCHIMLNSCVATRFWIKFSTFLTT